MSYFWTDFASLEALTHNPVHRVAIALIHLNIKRIGDDSLFDGQQTLINNDSQAYLLYFMWLVSSHFVEIKRNASDAQPAQIWAEIFEVNQTSFISAVNSQKSIFPFGHVASACPKSVLLYSACTQLGQMTLSLQCELWPSLALFLSMQRIVGKNSKKAWLLVEQAKCEYWS